MEILYFIISLLASIVGAVCGIGGGVVIKPVLDMFGLAGVATISFLSGCTVLTMSLYSMLHIARSKEPNMDYRFCAPLAVCAAVGGVAGKMLFTAMLGLAGNQEAVGRLQAVCLAVITLATFIYTLAKAKIKTKDLKGEAPRVLIGFLLGLMSSFLGIGGGPVNLVVLCYFFSMDTKTAVNSSLYIILVSQVASLVTSIVTRSVPPFALLPLALMIAGGLGGGIIGRRLNKKMSHGAIDKMFLCVMALIIGVCVFNAVR